MHKLCEYGCGREAKYQFKNGKWCCIKNCRTCPVVRKKQSESHKGKIQSEETRKKLSEANKGQIPWSKGKILGPHSEETRKKISKGNKGKHKEKKKFTIDQIKEKYPLFSKIEEMRYNPVKPNIKEIQVRYKNHECINSKERGGWFTPKNYYIFANRIWAIERPDGNGGVYFYCSQHCKDACPLYGLQSDPLKENSLPYTHSEDIEVKRRAWERDNGICQDCGGPGTEVHHIKPVKLEPFFSLDIDNLITLCEDCHKKYHKQGLKNSTGGLANIICSPKSQRFLEQKK